MSNKIDTDKNFDFLINLEELNPKLINYGWFITPQMTRSEINRLEVYCSNLDSPNVPSKSKIQEDLNELFEGIVFHPNYRAFYIYRSMKLPHLREFSHFLERAVLNYYKHDYLSCILTLIPAVEGVLLSHFGWVFGSSKRPGQIDFIQKIKSNLPKSSLIKRHSLYAEATILFLEKWIFKNTNSADFSFSYLNRHYISHGMGNGNFYSIVECHRLLLFFDLYTELLSLEYDSEYYNFIPTDKPELNRRRSHYLLSVTGLIPRKLDQMQEELLLKEHKNYHAETHRPASEPGIASVALNLFAVIFQNKTK